MNSENNNKQTTNNVNEVTMEPKAKRKVEDLQMPELSNEHVVIETVKKKPSSSAPYIIILVLITALVVWKIDTIMSFFDNSTDNPGISKTEENSLIDGYLLLGDTTSNIKVEGIKFYNFKKNNDFSCSFNYAATDKINKEDFNNIYIELYDSEKNVIYKTLFTIDDNLSKGDVKTYSFNVDSYVYNNAKYSLIKKYEDSELNSETTLTCKFNETSENYNLLYKNVYVFKNNLLVSYTVYKQIEIYENDNMTKKYQNEIKSEYGIVTENSIENTYTENSLTYTLDLTSEYGSLIPLYEKNTTINVVKNKDIEKKWECE